jgi:hypothetical protein
MDGAEPAGSVKETALPGAAGAADLDQFVAEGPGSLGDRVQGQFTLSDGDQKGEGKLP